MSRARSSSPNAATTTGSKPWNASRNAWRLRRIVDHDKPGLEGLQREPLEQLDVVVDRRAPLLVVVRDHHRVRVRGGGAGPRAAWPVVDRHRGREDSGMADRATPRGAAAGYGIGAVSKSVLRSIGSPLGRDRLRIDRKTSPETFFLPLEPMSVTLISRPETPRSRRSSAVSVPTFGPAVGREPCGQRRALVRLHRPRRVRRGLVVRRAVVAPVGRPAQVADHAGDPLAGRGHVHVLVVLGRPAAGRVEHRVRDLRAASRGRRRRCRRWPCRSPRARPSPRGRPVSACRRRCRSRRRPGGACAPRTTEPRSPAPGAPRSASSRASRTARRRGGSPRAGAG